MSLLDWLERNAYSKKETGTQAAVDRVLAHMHQVPKGWVIDGEWMGRSGNANCACSAVVYVALGRLVEDWPKARHVEGVYVCSACGNGADRANQKFNERIQAAFAERLGVTPPVPASPPTVGPFQQAIMQQQAQMAADLRRAGLVRTMLANPTSLSDYMEDAILGAKGGGDK